MLLGDAHAALPFLDGKIVGKFETLDDHFEGVALLTGTKSLVIISMNHVF